MECTEARTLLDAYFDRQLDLPHAVAVEQHLVSCAGCRAILAARSALRSGIRDHIDYRHGAPERLAEGVRARLGIASDTRVRTSSARWRLPRLGQWLPIGAAAAVAAMISWTAAIQYASPSADSVIADQVLRGHARSIVTSHLIEVASSDQHSVKPWLSSKLDFSPPVPDLSAAGFQLAGARLDYMDNRPVAALVYRSRQHVINLFVWPSERLSGEHVLSKHGYNVVGWSRSGMTYWATSDINAAELSAFADAWAQASR
jgi:anti-sigma factor RsiW